MSYPWPGSDAYGWGGTPQYDWGGTTQEFSMPTFYSRDPSTWSSTEQWAYNENKRAADSAGLSIEDYIRFQQTGQAPSGMTSEQTIAALTPWGEQRRDELGGGNWFSDTLGSALTTSAGVVNEAGEFIEENPALLLAGPLGLAAMGGYFGAAGAAGAGGATSGSGTATVSSSIASPGIAPGAVDVAGMVSGGMGPQAVVGGAGAGAGSFVANNLPAILSGGASLIGGVLASNSADDAVDAMTQSNSEALDYQRESRDIALGLLEPERQSANAAIARMLQMQGLPIPASLQADLDASGVALDDFDVTETPGYQLRLDESMRALEAGAFARGGGMSGGFARSALRYAQDYASNEYNNIYSQLATIVGRSTSTRSANTALNYGTESARITQDTGDARASGYVAQSNAWQNALDQVAQLPWDQRFPGRQRQAVGV
jgi:hypothetical protein